MENNKTQRRPYVRPEADLWLLRLGEKPTHMGKASMLKLVKTLLTNKAVGE